MVWYSPPEPPPFVRLAADPLRWRLLTELACGDRRVRELVELLNQPQNLISYHLGKLRDAGLVGARRSSFDGRDTYYHLDLARCARSLTATGSALHPGLGPNPSPTSPATGGCRVLFLSTGDSARSPMAEALLQLRAGHVTAIGAGSHPRPGHPNAVRVLREEYGLDIAGRRPRHLDALAGQRFDVVISLCDQAREIRPMFPGHYESIHWSVPDPTADRAQTDTASYPAFQRTAAELDDRISFLVPALDHVTPHRAASSSR